MSHADHLDVERPSGVYPRAGLDEDTIALLRALYALAFDAVTERRLACSVAIRELADDVAVGAPLGVERLRKLSEMADAKSDEAFRIVEKWALGNVEPWAVGS